MWLTAWPSRSLQKPCSSALLFIPRFSVSFACNFTNVSVGELSGFSMSLCIFSHSRSVLCMSVYVSVHLWISLCFLCFSLALSKCLFSTVFMTVCDTVCVFFSHWVSLFISVSVYLCFHISESGHALCLYVSLVIFSPYLFMLPSVNLCLCTFVECPFWWRWRK